MKNMMVFFLFTIIFVSGCSDNSTNNPNSTVSDSVFTDIRDGKKYGIVKINSQVWMSENLNASTYRNGDSIFYARTPEEWLDADTRQEGSWCYYDNDPKNGEVYGKLYNWYAVNDSRGLAPIGYHVPSDLEWTILIDFLGGKDIAGRMMKSKTGWENNGNGNSNSGFNGLPGGNCDYMENFYNITGVGNWWSSSEEDPGNALSRNLSYENTEVKRYINYKNSGFSVRCIKD